MVKSMVSPKPFLKEFGLSGIEKNLLKGKLCATVMTGMEPKAVDAINMALAAEIREYEHMELVGQLTVSSDKDDTSWVAGLIMLA